MTTINIKGNGKRILVPLKDLSKNEPKKTATPTQDKESLTVKLNRTIINTRIDGAFNAAKTGILSSYVIAFGLLMGFTPATIALLTSIPLLIGSASQLFVGRLADLFKSRFKLLIIASRLETFNWFILTILTIAAIKNPVLIIALVTLDAVFMNIQSPIYNAILADTIPDGKRGKNMSVRNRLTGLASFVSMVFAGYILSLASKTNPLIGFVIIFSIAIICSAGATRFRRKLYDPKPLNYKSEDYSLIQFFKTIKKNNFGIFTSFIATYKFAVYIASPFFAVYMLKILNFDYLTFMIITASAVIASFTSMRLWGRIIDKYGSRIGFSITSFLIVPVPLLWLTTTNWKLLAAIEVLSGIVWAGFNLSTSIFIHEAITPKLRIKFFSYNHLTAGIGIFLGTIIGGWIISFEPVLFKSSFLLVFFISGLLRLVTAAIFVPRIQEEKIVSVNLKKQPTLFKSFITLRPKEGVIYDIVGDNNFIEQKKVFKKLKAKIKNKRFATNTPIVGNYGLLK